ncbi:hypothetical protein KR018_006256 [Drosophila ironensis]|nr:hypothetical protein KR018_006256 [Drosophila ironensis]
MNNPAQVHDSQLHYNLMAMEVCLSSLIDANEQEAPRRPPSTVVPVSATVPRGPGENATSADLVLADLQRNLRDLQLPEEQPGFEFHGLGCLQAHQNRCQQSGDSETCMPWATEQLRARTSRQDQMVSDRKQQQLQLENKWNQQVTTPYLLAQIGLNGHCRETNKGLRLMDLISSVHDLLTVDLSCSYQNSLPSDYIFNIPANRVMPKGTNFRHQVQVLYSKVDKFLDKEKRTLMANRSLDYDKYNECSKLLNRSVSYLDTLKQFLFVELRHINGHPLRARSAANFGRLEKMLLYLRDSLKATHLSIYVFNWEMDLEYRYSAVMLQSLQALREHALKLAAAEVKAAQPRVFDTEQQFIAQKYNIGNVVQCAAEHGKFLSELVANPEAYFPPQIVDLVKRPKNERPGAVNLQASAEKLLIDSLWQMGDIIEPSSPPRHADRPIHPRRFRS